MRNQGLNIRTALVAAACLGVAGAAIAADDKAVIKYRQAVMKGHGAHLGAMFQIVKGGAGRSDDLAVHARGLHDVSKMIVPAFNKRTEGDKTESKPEIWSDAEGFAAKAGDMEKAAEAVVAAVASGDQAAIGKALGGAGDGCKGCHKNYRVKK